MASNAEPIFLDAGEAALVVEFGRSIEPEIHNRVLALDAALGKRALPGVVELVPTIRSLMIHYDPLVIDRAALIDAVRGIETGAAETKPARRWTVPCCYDPQFGEDIATIAEQLRMTPERVVALHSGATYRAYMYGFLPGFCYLGGLPKELTVARRVTIRPPHPTRHDHDRRRHGTDHDLRDADRLVAGRPHAGAHVLARHGKKRSSPRSATRSNSSRSTSIRFTRSTAAPRPAKSSPQ